MPRRRSRRPFRLASLLAAAALALSVAGAAGVALTLLRRPTRSVLQLAAPPLALPALRVTPTATPSVPAPPRDGALQDAEDALRGDPVYLPQDSDPADTSAMESVVQGAGGGLYVAQLPATSARFAGGGQQLVDRLCHDLALTGYDPDPSCVVLADRQLWLSSAVLSRTELDALRRRATAGAATDPDSALGVLAASLGADLGSLRASEADADADAPATPEPRAPGSGLPYPRLAEQGVLSATLLLLLWRVVAVRSGRVHDGRHC
ncbi:hypothetical protein LN042_12505 [Kitasatospora sp. RB6PN24]|uniref:hypothetical protein n=1 Tax=Kitasatospora humi TaxID=2893891 RepID=UPI001E597717|nr:hypothetical protein [Kitasatospora humi]MCC9307903.1 hypothetical protein [Kitasatospora humi]